MKKTTTSCVTANKSNYLFEDFVVVRNRCFRFTFSWGFLEAGAPTLDNSTENECIVTF